MNQIQGFSYIGLVIFLLKHKRPPGGVTPNPVRSRNRIRRPIKKDALVILTIPAAGKQQKAQIITAGRGRNSLLIA